MGECCEKAAAYCGSGPRLSGLWMHESEEKFNKMSARFGAERTAAALEGYRTGRGASINRLHTFFYRKFSKQETRIINSGAETLAHLEVLKTTDDPKKQQDAVRALSEMYCPPKVAELVRDALERDNGLIETYRVLILLEKVFGSEEAVKLLKLADKMTAEHNDPLTGLRFY